jgi:hypothetical protein
VLALLGAAGAAGGWLVQGACEASAAVKRLVTGENVKTAR